MTELESNQSNPQTDTTVNTMSDNLTCTKWLRIAIHSIHLKCVSVRISGPTNTSHTCTLVHLYTCTLVYGCKTRSTYMYCRWTLTFLGISHLICTHFYNWGHLQTIIAIVPFCFKSLVYTINKHTDTHTHTHTHTQWTADRLTDTKWKQTSLLKMPHG